MNNRAKRIQHLQQFYELLDELEGHVRGARLISECTVQMGWPFRAVFFLREPGEVRSDTGSGPRIVHVGTHGVQQISGYSFWDRLSLDKGTALTGGGDHRQSKFRLLVGNALIMRDELDYPRWGSYSKVTRQIRQTEEPLEKVVSKVVGNMQCIWLAVNDARGPGNLRGYIMRNAVALLSNCYKKRVDLPSENWLGHSSKFEEVRKSGLWNCKYVDDIYDPGFLQVLKRLVRDQAPAGEALQKVARMRR